MSDISQMFLNRVKYHAASRLASQTGEGLAQALSVDGHTVSYDKIWSASTNDFPNQADPNQKNPINATTDLINVFKTETFTSVSGTFNADVKYYTYD
jgi:L-aminopeptidase/D-esterase-like protein